MFLSQYTLLLSLNNSKFTKKLEDAKDTNKQGGTRKLCYPSAGAGVYQGTREGGRLKKEGPRPAQSMAKRG